MIAPATQNMPAVTRKTASRMRTHSSTLTSRLLERRERGLDQPTTEDDRRHRGGDVVDDVRDGPPHEHGRHIAAQRRIGGGLHRLVCVLHRIVVEDVSHRPSLSAASYNARRY